MSKQVNIVGAGLSGLLSAYYFSIKGYDVTVIEKKKKIENSHQAILRFRKDPVDIWSGISFPIEVEKVTIMKNVYHLSELKNECSILMNNQYSLKVTGELGRRSITNLADEERWVPSNPDFYYKLLNSLRMMGVEFKTGVGFKKVMASKEVPTILTIPLPAIIKEFYGNEVERQDWSHKGIATWTADLKHKANIHQTIYFPESYQQTYRSSIVKDKIIAELPEVLHDSNGQPIIPANIRGQLEHAFGVRLSKESEFSENPLGKLVNIEPEYRKHILARITKDHNCYMLGRFACWREGVMVPDVMKDIMRISRWIEAKDMTAYDRLKTI